MYPNMILLQIQLMWLQANEASNWTECTEGIVLSLVLLEANFDTCCIAREM